MGIHLPTLLIGLAAVGYGIYTAITRARSPEKFKKLEPMKKFWGPRMGIAIHVMGYTLLPVLFGLVAIWNAPIDLVLLISY